MLHRALGTDPPPSQPHAGARPDRQQLRLDSRALPALALQPQQPQLRDGSWWPRWLWPWGGRAEPLRTVRVVPHWRDGRPASPVDLALPPSHIERELTPAGDGAPGLADYNASSLVPLIPWSYAWMSDAEEMHARSSGFDIGVARTLALYAANAYCNTSNLPAWNCSRCDGEAAGVEVRAGRQAGGRAGGAVGQAGALLAGMRHRGAGSPRSCAAGQGEERGAPAAGRSGRPPGQGRSCAHARTQPRPACERARSKCAVQGVSVVYDELWNLVAYVGFSTRLNGIIVSFRGTDSHSLYNWCGPRAGALAGLAQLLAFVLPPPWPAGLRERGGAVPCACQLPARRLEVVAAGGDAAPAAAAPAALQGREHAHLADRHAH